MSEQHQDNLTLQEVEGIHYLDSTPSLFVSKTASPVTLPEGVFQPRDCIRRLLAVSFFKTCLAEHRIHC